MKILNFESKFPYQRKADKQICYTAIFQKYKNLVYVEWKMRKKHPKKDSCATSMKLTCKQGTYIMVTSVLCTADAVGSRRTERGRSVGQSVWLLFSYGNRSKSMFCCIRKGGMRNQERKKESGTCPKAGERGVGAALFVCSFLGEDRRSHGRSRKCPGDGDGRRGTGRRWSV